MAAIHFLIIICGVTPVNIACVPCLQENKTPFLKSIDEGMKLLENSQGGDFAVVMGMPKAKYLVSLPPCELMWVGKFRPCYDAMIVRKNTSLRDKFDSAMTTLEKNGQMTSIRNKWFESKCEISVADPAPVPVATLGIVIIGVLLSLNYLY